MEANRPNDVKAGRTFDSAFSFSFSIALGLLLFIGGLVISLTFGNTNTLGLIFGIPLLIAGLVLPLFMMRDLFSKNEISGSCPYCAVPIKTANSTLQLECPGCGRAVGVRDTKLWALED